jgi:hypothetical protein
MKKKSLIQGERRWDTAALDELIDEFTVEASGEDERILAFLQALEKHVALPCNGFVIGEAVSVVKFDYQGNRRRGLTVKCRRADGSEYEVTASEVALSPGTPGSRYLAAYRKWMGVEPYPPETRSTTSTKSSVAALDLRGAVELAVLSVKQRAAHCRLLGSDQSVMLGAGRLWAVVPGEIAVVRPGKQWNYARNPYLSGVIESMRLDVSALGLVPLRLEEQGIWDPSQHYWGEDDEPIEEWAKPIIARGPRPEFEMEQVLPGADFDDPFSDPITESNDRRDSGDSEGATRS